MNKHTIALLVILVVIGGGLYALADYQHGKVLPPAGAVSKGGGLVINGGAVSIPAAAEGDQAAASSLPGSGTLSAPAENGATCP